MAKRKITEIAEEALKGFLPENGYELYNTEFVKDIHPMTKVTNVLETGKTEKNCFYFSSAVTNVARIAPLYKEGEIVGAIDYDIFTNGPEIQNFLDKLSEYSDRNILNFNTTFRSMYNASKKANPIKYTINDFIGDSYASRNIKAQIANLSESDSTVLITGNTGCGKEIVAHAIHNISNRCQHPIIAINCAAIPETLFESELFGYDEGTFTGACSGGKRGYFEMADKGTIFLDEIDQIPYHIQPKLLRVLQEKKVTLIGGRTVPVDIRVIAATNKNLWNMVTENKFREDLYYRLNVVEINIPPLAERKEDIPLIADDQLKKLNMQMAKNVRSISSEVMELFLNYDWPGNVRELNNLLERSMILCHEDTLNLEHLGSFVSKALETKQDSALSAETPLEQIRMRAEADAIRKTLDLVGGNKSKAAGILKISRTALYDKMKKYHIL